MNHLIYFDNWFASLPLITTLEKKNIYALGTVRQCRLPNITFPPDKELVKKGRGEHVELETKIDGVDIRAVKWADSRCVSLVSSFSCAYPLQEVKSIDKKQKKTVTIPCPHIVKIYNQFMGGLDFNECCFRLAQDSHQVKEILPQTNISVSECFDCKFLASI